YTYLYNYFYIIKITVLKFTNSNIYISTLLSPSNIYFFLTCIISTYTYFGLLNTYTLLLLYYIFPFNYQYQSNIPIHIIHIVSLFLLIYKFYRIIFKQSNTQF